MPRPETNRFTEMEVFVRVVELGGFSAAARASDVTPSAVSKLVTRLEKRLGVRLVNRSTRQLQITAEGCTFYERASRILADLADAERAAGAGEAAMGLVRITTSASYLAHILAPLLPHFLALHPGITIDIVQTDAVVDLLAERADIAVRAGPLKASRLVARKLGETAMVTVAAPAYLERCGMPGSVAELERHTRLGLGYARAVSGWALREQGREVILPASGQIQVSDGEALRHLAVAGVGIARLASFTVRRDVAEGRLVPILAELEAGQTETFHAVHVGAGGPLPARVRAMLDFLGTHGRVS